LRSSIVQQRGRQELRPRNRNSCQSLESTASEQASQLLFDLLTREEEEIDLHTREHCFYIALLAQRLTHGTSPTQAVMTPPGGGSFMIEPAFLATLMAKLAMQRVHLQWLVLANGPERSPKAVRNPRGT
jgi:hypothetical protein